MQPADDLPGYVEGLVRAFEEQRTEGESFSEWAVRADESALS